MNHSDDFLFQHSKLGIAYIGLDGSCLKINDTMCGILGYSQEEMKHLNFQDLVYPDDLAESIDEFEKLLEGTADQFTAEKRYIHKTGYILWLNKTLSMVKNDMNEPQLLIAQIQDITDRKKAEGDLNEAEIFRRNVFEQALVGIYLHQDGKIRYINPYMANMFGYTPEEFIQLKAKDLIVEEDYVEVAKQARKTIAENNPTMKFAIKAYKKDQTIIHLQGHCVLTTYKGNTSIQGIVLDVTYKKQTEELLLENANRFQRMLEYLPEPILFTGRGLFSM
jgi:PAS domain S-box-containing protein